MIKLTLVTQDDLPLGAPKPSEHRAPVALLPATRVHTWLCRTTDDAAWTMSALAAAGVTPEVHGIGGKVGAVC